MAKKKKNRRKRNGFTLPISILAPLGIEAARKYGEFKRGISTAEMLDRTLYHFTGFSMIHANWKLDRMYYGAFPLLGGIIVHKVANRLGINRAISQTGIPWIRI